MKAIFYLASFNIEFKSLLAKRLSHSNQDRRLFLVWARNSLACD